MMKPKIKKSVSTIRLLTCCVMSALLLFVSPAVILADASTRIAVSGQDVQTSNTPAEGEKSDADYTAAEPDAGIAAEEPAADSLAGNTAEEPGADSPTWNTPEEPSADNNHTADSTPDQPDADSTIADTAQGPVTDSTPDQPDADSTISDTAQGPVADSTAGNTLDELGVEGTVPDTADEEQIPQPEETEQEPEDTLDPDEEEITSVSVTVSQKKKEQTALLKWKQVKGAVSFQVERKKEGNQAFRKIADIDSSKRSYPDASVKRGTAYKYRVAASMEDGRKVYSKPVSFQCLFEEVSGVSLIRYSTSSIKMVWEKSKDQKVKYYHVYDAKSNKDPEKFSLAATTKNNWYRFKKLKNDQDYFFCVKAGSSKKPAKTDSAASKVVKMHTKPYERLTIFAGDSITSGLNDYHILSEIAIGGRKKVLAAVGLNTTTFRTRRTFQGQTAMQSIISSKPYRVYLMLGANDIHYRSVADLIEGYREILRNIRAGSPDTDIVIQAVSPVTLAKVNESGGFAQIPNYNKQLEKLAKEFGVRYCDCTSFMKDSTGWLNRSYAAPDGYHWTISAYQNYAKRIKAFDQSLD